MKRTTIGIWIATFTAASLIFAVVGRYGINLADEGYYYYAVLGLGHGEIPIADFQSYDPLRFYWSAAWTWLFGEGLMVVRASRAFFVAVGVAFVVTAAAEVTKSRAALATLGAAMLMLGQLYVAYFVCGVTTWIGVAILSRPTRRWIAAAGVWTGIAAGIGHNHGLYVAISLGVLSLWAARTLEGRNRTQGAFTFVGGGLVGFSPILIHWIVVPRMLDRFLNTQLMRYFLEGSTNLPLPVPWPWTVDLSSGLPTIISSLALGTLFVLLPVTFVVATAILVRNRASTENANGRLMLAATVVGLPYLHYAFARADLEHLNHGIIPAMVVAFAVLTYTARAGFHRASRFCAMVLVGTVACANLAHSHFLHSLVDREPYIAVDVRGSTIMVREPNAARIQAVRDIANNLVDPQQGLYLAPRWPMMYCILDRRSPTWPIFQGFARDEEFQREMIRDFETSETDWLIVAEDSPDGDAERNFSKLLVLVQEYFDANFEEVGAPRLPPPHRLYRRRGSSPD
jgi:hypothetical protein